MTTKDAKIRQAQAIIARLNENLDYQTKVLYNQVRASVKYLDDEQLANLIRASLRD